MPEAAIVGGIKARLLLVAIIGSAAQADLALGVRVAITFEKEMKKEKNKKTITFAFLATVRLRATGVASVAPWVGAK